MINADVWKDVKNFELKDMVVGKRYKLKLRDGEIHEHTCNIMYDDYVNFGYFNWNFYFNGKYKDQDLPGMDIISFCEISEIDYEKEYNTLLQTHTELQERCNRYENALEFYANRNSWCEGSLYGGSVTFLNCGDLDKDETPWEIAEIALTTPQPKDM